MRTVAIVGACALLAVGCGSSSTSSGTSTTGSTSTASSSAASSQPVAPASGAHLATQSTNALALEMLRSLGTKASNTVFSPYSVQAALAMVYTGAAGETATQIGKVLDAPNAAALASANGALTGRLTAAVTSKNNGAGLAPRLSIANGLWVQSGLQLKVAFTQAVMSAFGAALKQVDFRHQPEAARQQINAWIAAKTARLIQNLMPPGSITPQTALVLANAIYLKARWQSPFVSGATLPATFFTATGSRVKAPFMSLPMTPLPYATSSAYQAVDLPYRSSTLSMLLIIPRTGTIDAFERSLTPNALSALTGSLHTAQVALRMPRFHLAAHIDLRGTLSALGMPIAFTNRADFSGITAAEPLAIDAVEHGADLKVDEAGTIAAAATGISVSPTAVLPGRVTHVLLDHPFLLFLRDDATGAILFAGRVNDPTQS